MQGSSLHVQNASLCCRRACHSHYLLTCVMKFSYVLVL